MSKDPSTNQGNSTRYLIIPDLGTIIFTDETNTGNILKDHLQTAFIDAWQLLPTAAREAITGYLKAKAKRYSCPYLINLRFVTFKCPANDIDAWELRDWEDDCTDYLWVYDVRIWPKTPRHQRRAILFLLANLLDHAVFFTNIKNSLVHTDNVFYIGQGEDMVRYWETGKQSKSFKRFIKATEDTIDELQAARAAYLGVDTSKP